MDTNKIAASWAVTASSSGSLISTAATSGFKVSMSSFLGSAAPNNWEMRWCRSTLRLKSTCVTADTASPGLLHQNPWTQTRVRSISGWNILETERDNSSLRVSTSTCISRQLAVSQSIRWISSFRHCSMLSFGSIYWSKICWKPSRSQTLSDTELTPACCDNGRFCHRT